MDHAFNQLKGAAEVNLAFVFVMKNIEDGTRRYFYAHENNTVMERSKVICTQDDMDNLQVKLQKLDIFDHCTRERANTKWKFYKLSNVTVIASLLRDIPMGCKDTVLPESLFEKPQCLLSNFQEKYETTLE